MPTPAPRVDGPGTVNEGEEPKLEPKLEELPEADKPAFPFALNLREDEEGGVNSELLRVRGVVLVDRVRG
jgi:hypothetical protein